MMGKGYEELTAEGQAEREALERVKRAPAEQASRDRYAAALPWAKRALPEEHGPFAASAALTLKLQKTKVTPQRVLARLKAQRKDRASIDARAVRMRAEGPE